jgi:hypothetical protein
MIWTGVVQEVNGDDLTVDLRSDGHQDMVAEVSISRWNLETAGIGSVVELDTEAQTVTLIDLGVWTQEEIDDIKAQAKAQYERLMEIIEQAAGEFRSDKV